MEKKKAMIWISISLLIVFFAFSIFNFQKNIEKIVIDETQAQLQEVSDATMHMIEMQLNGKIQLLELAASGLNNFDLSNTANYDTYLSLLSSQLAFSDFGIANVNGDAWIHDGTRMNVSNRAYFQEALMGNSIISDILSSHKQSRFFTVAVPIRKQDRVIGVLFGVHNTSEFDKILDLSSFQDLGNQLLLSNEGEIIFKSDLPFLEGKDNFWRAYEQLGNSKADIIEQIQQEQKAFFQFSANDTQYYACAQQMQMNGWISLSVVPREYMTLPVYQIMEYGFQFVLKNVIGILIVVIYFVSVLNQNLRKTKSINHELMVNEQVLNIALDHNQKIIFEYYYQTKDIKVINGNYRPLSTNLIDFQFIEPSFHTLVKEFFIKMSSMPQASEKIVFQAKLINSNEYRWTSLQLNNICDEKSQIIKAIGTVEDIQDYKEKEIELEKIANQDGLTKLYNRQTSATLINQRLQKSKGHYAFMILDLDNFKHINDTYGHAVGDELLVDVSASLTKIFRKEDILIRLGGDEFVIFMNDEVDKSVIEQKAQVIVEKVRQCYQAIEPNGLGCCSIGISISNVESTFDSLYREADYALYVSKNLGKGRYAFYVQENT